jgi:spore coat polysaccharide biosynthesis protein SpsF
MSKRRIGIIIQARTDSSRFPKKVLTKIEGKPLLWYVLQRAKKIGYEVIVATTKRTKDDIIVTIAKKSNVKVYRGKTKNVLDRYIQAATENQIDTIVRITSDCPLIDPSESKKVIQKFLKGNFDYVATDEKSYPKGLDTECFDLETLKRVVKSTNEKLDKEHVTQYIYNNPKKFKIGFLINKKSIPTTMRWVVDYKEDLIFIKKIYSRLYKKNHIFLMNDIIKLLKKDGSLTHPLENKV